MLTFDEGKHRYTANGKPALPVTTIIGVIDKSGPLMGWALKEAARYVRDELENTWIDPLTEDEVDAVCLNIPKVARKKSKWAADIGTQAHKWIESHIAAQQLFEPAPDLPTDELVRACVEKFLAWEMNNHVQYIESERKIYSLKHGYAGTLDCIAILNDKRVLLDFKTSNGLYPEYNIQTAAYQMAYEEEVNHSIEGRVLLRIGKEDGSFEDKPLPRCEADLSDQAFLHCLGLYSWLKQEKG